MTAALEGLAHLVVKEDQAVVKAMAKVVARIIHRKMAQAAAEVAAKLAAKKAKKRRQEQARKQQAEADPRESTESDLAQSTEPDLSQSAESQLAQPPEAEESCALPSSDDSQQEPDVARPNMEQCEQAGYATHSPPLPPTVLIRDQQPSTGIAPHLHTAGAV